MGLVTNACQFMTTLWDSGRFIRLDLKPVGNGSLSTVQDEIKILVSDARTELRCSIGRIKGHPSHRSIIRPIRFESSILTAF